MEDTTAKIPHRTQVPRDTEAATQTPAAGVAATICRTAISRNTTECTSATTARLRSVRMEYPLILSPLYRSFGQETVIHIT